MPVVDGDYQLVGIVAEADLLRDRLPPDPRLHLRRDEEAAENTPALLVRGAMTVDVRVVEAAADVADVARLFVDERIRSVPVLEGGRLVGIVSRRDVLRALVRPDDEIRRDLLRLVEGYTGDPTWDVAVTEGVATVRRTRGTPDGPAGVEDRALRALAHTVPGVERAGPSRYAGGRPGAGRPPAAGRGERESENMTQELRARPVVVGVDASQAALRATRFAAEEATPVGPAADRPRPRRRVRGHDRPARGTGRARAVDAGAQTLVQAMADSVGGLVPAHHVHTSVVEGHPVEVLRHASSDASLVVLGGRGVGGTRVCSSSTASRVVATADCPVAVLLHDTVRARGRQSVVVGVEGRGDEEILAFAFAEAAARHTDLVAVHAWQGGRGVPLDQPPDRLGRRDGRRGAPAGRGAGRLVGEGTGRAVREVVVREKTARALVAAGATAELWSSAITGAGTLGSTTHAVLHRANCPVAVVPLGAGGKP